MKIPQNENSHSQDLNLATNFNDLQNLNSTNSNEQNPKISPILNSNLSDENPAFSSKPFSLAQSLEVAEHIDEIYADNFILLLTNLADIVLFSAAAPYQGGTHHVNEKEPFYWAEKFAKCDFACFDIREFFWDDGKIDCCYRQNVLLFVAKSEISRFAHLKQVAKPLYIVHPQIWEWRNQHLNGFDGLQARYEALERKYNKTIRRRAKRVWKKFYEWQKGFERKFRTWRKTQKNK